MKTDRQLLTRRLLLRTDALLHEAVSFYDIASVDELAPEQMDDVAQALRACVEAIDTDIALFEEKRGESCRS